MNDTAKMVKRPEHFVEPILVERIEDGVSQITMTIRHGDREAADLAMEIYSAVGRFLAQ